MAERLGAAASGRTWVRSSIRNRRGWVNAAKWRGVVDQRQPLGRRLHLFEVLLGQGGQGDHIALALQEEERDLQAAAQPPGLIGPSVRRTSARWTTGIV
jgi:hypothetical protein